MTHRLAALFALLLAAPASGHEFWIDPHVANGTISADLRVGEDLRGDTLSFRPDIVAAMRHVTSEGAISDITARIGDLPAIASVPVDPRGTNLLAVETNPAYIVFADMDEFGDYLAYEGWSEIVAAHRARELSEVDVAEEYYRHAKALVPVGDGSIRIVDRSAGLAFELILSPFGPTDTEVPVQLLWQSEPTADVQISVFHRSDDRTTRTLVRSGGDGRTIVPLRGAGDYLLNAVRIDAATGPGSVVWQSHWASLTFTLPE